jgi:hypothetical protein
MRGARRRRVATFVGITVQPSHAVTKRSAVCSKLSASKQSHFARKSIASPDLLPKVFPRPEQM